MSGQCLRQAGSAAQGEAAASFHRRYGLSSSQGPSCGHPPAPPASYKRLLLSFHIVRFIFLSAATNRKLAALTQAQSCETQAGSLRRGEAPQGRLFPSQPLTMTLFPQPQGTSIAQSWNRSSSAHLATRRSVCSTRLVRRENLPCSPTKPCRCERDSFLLGSDKLSQSLSGEGASLSLRSASSTRDGYGSRERGRQALNQAQSAAPQQAKPKQSQQGRPR